MTAEARFINRELSWLEFNQRVLQEAQDPSLPLLERLKFLAITASNLDEFFMVRVGSLEILSRQRVRTKDPSGLTPYEQLGAISKRTHEMLYDQYVCYLEDLEPKLVENGIRRVRANGLSDEQAVHLEEYFQQEVYPVLSPMAVRTAEDFPQLPNQTLNVCVQLEPTETEPNEARFAVIPLGRSSRFITLPGTGDYEYILLEELVGYFVEQFFPGEKVRECVPFRITRNADMAVSEDSAADLLSEMEDLLDARKVSSCVRLEIADRVTSQMLMFLTDILEVKEEAIYSSPGPLDLAAFMGMSGLKGFEELTFDSWPPRHSPLINPARGLFEQIAERDLLLYHPYESFEPVTRLVEEAANDPDVLAIKQTLYRTSSDSPIVRALIRAAEKGKHVTVIVELKARFDEARNIEWAKTMEHSGVQVIYGVKGLKTHAKLCIVVRREPYGIVRYMHFGTGNYNEKTAKLYGDISYLTCSDELASDATSLFHAVTGYSHPQQYRKLEAAPLGLRDKVLELIDSEIERKKQGQKAEITAKINSLSDPEMIEALYKASEAGVKVRLNIRGICCLRPGTKTYSKNIQVVSIIDRFLEHARIFHFRHGGDNLVYISSADWMTRNLDRRVELFVPVEDPASRDRLIEILEIHFRDNVKAHKLLAGGNYKRVKPTGNRKPFRSQEALYEMACEAEQETLGMQPTIFEAHRAGDND